jgi:hypothetical protein
MIAASPAVLAAVGAIGNSLLKAEPATRSEMLAKAIADLQAVDWTKGERWVGIAGAQKPKGFSVNSPKEAGVQHLQRTVRPRERQLPARPSLHAGIAMIAPCGGCPVGGPHIGRAHDARTNGPDTS